MVSREHIDKSRIAQQKAFLSNQNVIIGTKETRETDSPPVKLGSVQCYANKQVQVKGTGKKAERFGIALDGDCIYVADVKDMKIKIFSMKGEFKGTIGDGKLHTPYSIAIYEDSVFVSDRRKDKILKLPKEQKFDGICETVGCFRGITISPSGEVYAAEYSKHYIAVFNTDLKLIRKLEGEKIRRPLDVKIHESKIFVVDTSEEENVHQFSETGKFVRSFIRVDSKLVFMTLDSCGNILISNFLQNMIQVFNQKGEMIHSIAYDSPAGIAVNDNFQIVCANRTHDIILIV